MTVFFVSASWGNPWLQAMFPAIQKRFGMYTAEDKKIFCLAARNFYVQLETESQKQTFADTFAKAAHTHPPYLDLVELLQAT